MTTMIASAVLFCVAAVVAILGFMSVRSDIQIIIGLLGLMFAGLFLLLALLAATLQEIRNELREFRDRQRP